MMTADQIKRIQARVGVAQDGIDGPATFKAIMAALDRAGAPAGPSVAPKALKDPAAFFAHLRANLFKGKLTEGQAAGVNAKLAAFGAAGWGIGFAAYGFATSYWETARTMQPIEEYGKGKGRPYGKPGRFGQSQHGRGDVQLTWDDNYARADKELGLGGSLTKNFNRALEPEISARVMVGGMSQGWFTGKKLGDYLAPDAPGTLPQFKLCRKIINGTDKQNEIAEIALQFQAALQAGGWS